MADACLGGVHSGPTPAFLSWTAFGTLEPLPANQRAAFGVNHKASHHLGGIIDGQFPIDLIPQMCQ
jgi:hypothetical protein